MKIIAPKYYNDFKCIADKCRHNCCIGWEIDIDCDTLEKYSSLENEYGAVIRESIDYGDSPHFRLGNDERCPHLDEHGLCRIISELGEDHLCEICHEHPRFYSFTPYGIEAGLGMACEEACRIILCSDLYGEFVVIGESADEPDESIFDPSSHRQIIFDVLSENTISHDQKLEKIIEIFPNSKIDCSEDKVKSILQALEYMSEENKALICGYSQKTQIPPALEAPLERAMAYFVYRHCTKAEDTFGFENVLRFSMLCYYVLRSLVYQNDIKTVNDLIPYARMLSEEFEYSEDNTYALLDNI